MFKEIIIIVTTAKPTAAYFSKMELLLSIIVWVRFCFLENKNSVPLQYRVFS